MGKYMRKCRGAAGDKERPGAAVELRAQVVVGVRTRSRSAAVSRAAAAVSKRRHQATSARVEEEALGRDVDGPAAGCYLHLRSRRLFMAAASVVAPRGRPGSEESSPMALADSGASGEVVVAGISRCSSTVSSVDVAAVRERSGGEAEACESCDGSGRERRETTPSSDVESSRQVAGEQKHQQRRRSPAATTSTAAATFHTAARAKMLPAAAEIEEFFAAAEKAEAERFAAKYNFDVAHGLPLSGGRFEWTPAACC